MKYKIGDRVRIKSIDWYNENKSKSHGTVACGGKYFDYDMREWCGKIMTILEVYKTCYIMEEDGAKDVWTDEMIECKVEEETQPKFKVGDRVITNKGYIGKFEGWVSDYQVRVLFEESGCNVVIHPKDLKLVEEETKILAAASIPDGPYTVTYDSPSMNDSISKNIIYNDIILPDGCIFKDENGNVINATKIVLEKKEYPKTCEECCKVLGIPKNGDIALVGNWRMEGYIAQHFEILRTLSKLLICCDAYWKIAGNEMGLGKPWEPDWEDDTTHKFIIHTIKDKICCGVSLVKNHALAFPTEEMCDAFKKNFSPDIELCKELL